MDDTGITRRVRTLRIRRGLTQQQFADALGRQLVWVKKFEAGDRQADPRISLLVDIARVLGVPLATLLDDPEPAPPTAAEQLRVALLRPAPQAQPGAVNVPRQTAYGYDAFQSGRFDDLGALLPDLIDAARANDTAAGTPDSGRALADAFHLASIALIKFGDGTAAWNAADKAMAVADVLDDPVEVALAAQTVAYAATVVGRPELGVDAAVSAIDRTEAPLSQLGESGWTALGLLYLKAAVASAGAADPLFAADMIEAGRRCAGHVRPDANVRRTGFNATNVQLYQASVLGDLGEHGAALEVTASIHPAAFAALPRERRIHCLLDTARSAQADRRPDVALRLVLQAERESPATVRTLPQAHTVITALLSGPRPSDDRGLHALAGRAGVAG